MTDAPEQIWVFAKDLPRNLVTCGDTQYTRSDIAAARIAALEAQVAAADRLEGLLEEASDDITAYVNAEYPPHDHARYPEIAKRNYRDLELVRRATAALAAYHATKETTC